MTTVSMWHRLAAGSGALAVGLIAAHGLLADPYDPALDPNPSQPSAVLAQALVNNRESARLGAYLGLLGAFFLIWFVGYLRHHLRHAEGDDGWLSDVAYASGMVITSLILVSIISTFAESEVSSYGDDTAVAKTYFILGWNGASVLAPPTGALVAATTIAGFRFAALPRWLGWFGVLIIVVIMLLTVTGTAGLSAMVGLVWLAVLSGVLVVQRGMSPPHRKLLPDSTP